MEKLRAEVAELEGRLAASRAFAAGAIHEVGRAVMSAIQAEREACANLADNEVVHSRDRDQTLCAAAERIAAAIRARKP